MKETNALQAKDSGLGFCICTIPRKHTPKERESNWFEKKNSTKHIPMGGRGSVKGERTRRQHPLQNRVKVPVTITFITTLMATLRENVGNYIQR
jgi:hypothetical protein